MEEAAVQTRPEPVATPDLYAEIAAAFDDLARSETIWARRSRGYHDLVTAVHQSIVPAGASVLELGSGAGDLLAALEPSRGVGVDVSAGMVELARARHPEIRFEHGPGEAIDLGLTFDYIVVSDLLPFVDDLLGLFRAVVRHSHPETRVVIHFHSQLWRPALRLFELLRLRPRKPVRNWVSPQDVTNLMALAGLESVTEARRILLPVRIPILSTLCNSFLANVWGLRHLCLTYWIVARPLPSGPPRELTASILVPAKNEAGMIERIVDETAFLADRSELIFVEGHSNDGTREEILRQIELHPERTIRYIEQTGTGKGDAVRLGFEQATGDILTILDADLTVRPRDLPPFFDAIATGRAEFANGSRLVYGVEPGAMRFLNVLGNKAFSIIFTSLLGQPIKDTLCGTKTLERHRYEQIAAGRAHFGDFDPFGDFDLLLGAARLNLKIVDLPIRYQARTYGETKISRFSHGWLLAKMALFAYRKLKADIFTPRRPTS